MSEQHTPLPWEIANFDREYPGVIEELLAAAKAWLKLVDPEGMGNCCGCNYSEETEQTRAAIAKAEGGRP